MIAGELVSGLIIPGMVINVNASKRCTITPKAMDCTLRCWDALLVHVDDARVFVNNHASDEITSMTAICVFTPALVDICPIRKPLSLELSCQ
jgi:hypothetical protein